MTLILPGVWWLTHSPGIQKKTHEEERNKKPMTDGNSESQMETHGKPTVGLETITPEEASILLRLNTRNRKINETLVDELVRQIQAGEFLLNGDTVRLSWPVGDGEIKLPILLDGQHRLRAIEKSGVALETIVVRGLDPKTQVTIDTGRKRTTADNLRIEGFKESTNLGAILAGAWKWDSGDRLFVSKPSPTPIECQRLFQENPERVNRALDVGLQTGREFPDLSKSALGIAHYILSAVDQEHTPYFFRLIGSGLKLTEGHPVAALRHRASSYRRQGAQQQPMTARRQVGMVIKAWNKCVLNEEVKNLTQDVSARVEEPLNPMGRWIPMLTDATFKSDE